MDDNAAPLAVLDALWKTLKGNYPAFEMVVGADGDAWWDEFHTRLESVSDLSVAYPILEELVNRFHDYHTKLIWPNKPPVESPPLRLGIVEEQVTVISLSGEAASPLSPGDVIIRIDDKDAQEQYREKLMVARGATVYARRQFAADRLLEGVPGSSVAVTAKRGTSGREETVTLTRRGPNTPAPPRPEMEVKQHAPDVGYVRIPTWQPPDEAQFLARFDAALDSLRAHPYLLIDVRGNGGGSDALADQVTGRFLEKPIVSSISFHRQAGTKDYKKTVEIARPRGPWRYEGRAAVLIDEGCMSACEHFVSGMRESGHVLLVGRPTTGACGWSRAHSLPGGATLFCSLTLPFHGPDPSPLHGIPPHVLVLPTLDALRASRDLAAERAFEYLRSGKPLPEV